MSISSSTAVMNSLLKQVIAGRQCNLQHWNAICSTGMIQLVHTICFVFLAISTERQLQPRLACPMQLLISSPYEKEGAILHVDCTHLDAF